MSRKKKASAPKGKICDPGMCDECLYIGEGDFLCDKHQTIVVSDWEATTDYLICERGRPNEQMREMPKI